MDKSLEHILNRREQKWPEYADMVHKYWTDLEPDEETEFRTWVGENKVPFDINDKRSDYDMRGFWKDMKTGGGKASSGVDQYDNKMHFTDHFKTPYHRTYSNESQGSTKDAPRWVEDGKYLVDRQGSILFDSTRGR